MTSGHECAEPIAVVGIGCRFPGARGPVSLWRLVRDGVDAITEIPACRFDVEALYDPTPGAPGKIATREGGFLDGVDRFDPYFFGISPREATVMDPQQRLLLEVAWEALEDAGQVAGELAGSATGVFVALWLSEYEKLSFAGGEPDLYASNGGSRHSASGRLSFAFDLQGPCMTVDTACSSSLVAVHLACRSLADGDSTLALAGGSNLILEPDTSVAFSRAGMLAPDGRCKAFDARADGYVRSEGVGLVVLKPLARAEADGDRIYAVVRATGVNNDGQSSGLLVSPSASAQEALLREVYGRAGIDPRAVRYVEAHGTGTRAGDPVEAEALGRVLGAGRRRPLAIGSVKTNIGHTEAASGVAGLIKTALSLAHRTLPPSLHCEQPNPKIPWDELKLAVHRQLAPWPDGPGPALAGINSFGVSGTNAHAVLAAPPPVAAQEDVVEGAAGPEHLLLLSAHSPEARLAMARSYRPLLAESRDGGETGAEASLANLCFSAAVRRSHHEHRLALSGDRETLVEALDAFLAGEPHPGAAFDHAPKGGASRAVFVFPGQGGQWLGMGRDLLRREPIFRRRFEACDRAAGGGLAAALADATTFERIDLLQPVLWALQVALAGLWRAWGVEPRAVIGTSMGEVAAACVAGALSLEDGARIIRRRSRLLRRTSGRGAMAVVELGFEEAGAAVAGFSDRVAIAISNSHRSTVLSGDPAALEEILAGLERREIFCRRIKVDVASHSPQMDPLKADLLAVLDGVRPRVGSLPFFSTVRGELLPGDKLDAEYWVRNLRRPVLFAATVSKLLADGCDTFIEIGPHPVLLAAIRENAGALDRPSGASSTPVLAVASLHRDRSSRDSLLTGLGDLWCRGAAVDWRHVLPAGRFVAPPLYPWQHERFWVDETAIRRRTPGGHPLLGRRVDLAAPPRHVWETELDRRRLAFVDDHRLEGVPVLPGTAYLELVRAAVAELDPDADSAVTLEDIEFHQGLFLGGDQPCHLQLVLSPRSAATGGGFSFQVFGRRGEDEGWIRHASGDVTSGVGDPSPAAGAGEGSPAAGEEELAAEDFYRWLAAAGNDWGPRHRGIDRLWRRDGEARAEVRLPEPLERERSIYGFHPALLDAGLQVLFAARPGAHAGAGPRVLAGLDRVVLTGRPGTVLSSRARLLEQTADGGLRGDLWLADAAGRELATIHGLRLAPLAGRCREAEVAGWLYGQAWEEIAAPSAAQTAGGTWLIFGDRHGTGATLARQLVERGGRVVQVRQGEGVPRTGTDAGSRRLAGQPREFEFDPRSPEPFRRLCDEVAGGATTCRGVIFLWGLDASSPEDGVAGCTGALHCLQAVLETEWPAGPPRFWLVTRGAQASCPAEAAPGEPALAQAPLLGLARTAASEHPELAITRVDLDSEAAPEAVAPLLDEVLSPATEDEVVRRGDRRLVPRLRRLAAADRAPAVRARGDQPFRLEIPRPGPLDDLALCAVDLPEPGPGEVMIRTRAAGLNFRDVMKALGIYPGLEAGQSVALGDECAGTIHAVGEGVEGWQPGDEVVAVAAGAGAFASYVRTDARMVACKPAGLSFAAAAALPVVFLTARYALEHLGRLRRGERVLIHCASGGVGLAAVALARRAGAEIFATAGSPEKRALLRELGIRHVMDSRSLDFAAEVRRLTGGAGVDVVLNSLAGEALARSLSLLAPHGRFLELGKRDVYGDGHLSLRPFRQSIAFFAIDLARIFADRPGLAGELLRGIVRDVERSDLEPLPHEELPVSRAGEAFLRMAQARHTGKLVVTFEEPEVAVSAPPADRLRADASYLITGGLGGLGLEVARWMIGRGARQLVLVGRSAPSPAARRVLEELRQMGARVESMRADVGRRRDLRRVLDGVASEWPPLSGVVHAAGVLDDGTLRALDAGRLEPVMAPKVSGAWHLHELIDHDLDFFVLFSSVASLLGTAGQASYAAANAFLDALAHHRRARGLPALAINWGPWSEVGLAAGDARGGRLGRRGLASIRPVDGLDVLGRLLRRGAAQAAAMPMDWSRWCRFHPAAAATSLLAEVASGSEPDAEAASGDALDRRTLLGVPAAERRGLIEPYLGRCVARVLGLPPARVDAGRPLNRSGLDSLMAVELRNRIEGDLGVRLPVARLLGGATPVDLAEQLVAALAATSRGEAPAPHAESPAHRALEELSVEAVDELSDQEVEALLSAVEEPV